MLKKYIGDRSFYKMVMAVALPIMLQNGITNFVSMLDNIMVGALGTVQMNGAAIANQLIFIFNLCIFGAVSGAGIFGAQFFGKKDWDSIRYTFRFKYLLCVLLAIVAILVFMFFSEPLLSLYIEAGEDPAAKEATLRHGQNYLFVMLIGLIPYALTQSFSSTLRESGETMLPMQAGVAAVCVNLTFNWVLIFGKLGCPALGVVGAAVATVISRFVELSIVVIWTWKHREQFPFIKRAFASLRIPVKLMGRIAAKGFPLMFNETFWALGIATLAQCYATRGLDAVAGNNIAQTFLNLFSVCFQAIGSAIGILLGQLLGAEEFKLVKDYSRKLLVFAVAVGAVVGVVFFALADVIPLLYNTSSAVRDIAADLIRLMAVTCPINAYAFAAYFTIRTGGNIFTTIAIDCGMTWVFAVPLVFALSRFTDLPVLFLLGGYEAQQLVKCFVFGFVVKRGKWIRNIVSQ